ncbi:hypothetical protein HKX48_005590 [Thoreauomyces humboldtii]|nr:hypothetical protein HKX48_005590 [Thoreauomyces humboldtii]
MAEPLSVAITAALDALGKTSSNGVPLLAGIDPSGATGFHLLVISTLVTPHTSPHPGALSTRTDRLILLSQPRSIDESYCSTSSDVLVFAMSVSEYVVQRPSGIHELLIHIGKIDTTGHAARTSTTTFIARSVVTGYLSHIYHTATADMKKTVHVFARAQPVYLFPSFVDNSSKRVLSDTALLTWWAKTLSVLPSSSRCYYVPNETARSVPSALRTATKEGWTWGLGHPQKTRAEDVLPRFPDDPIGKTMREHCGPNSTVEEIMEVVGLTGECSGRASGLFSVVLEPSAAVTDDGSDADAMPAADSSRAAYDAVERALMGGDYGSLEKARAATDKVLAALQEAKESGGRVYRVPVPLKVPPGPVEAIARPSGLVPMDGNVPEVIKDGASPIPSLGRGLIKRKAVAVAAPPSNAIQNLVKRKKTSESKATVP